MATLSVTPGVRFEERTSGREPSGRFSPDEAAYSRTYVLYNQDASGRDLPITTKDITDRLQLIIGTTLPGPATPPLGAPGGAGSIDRVLPMGDPQFLSLFADTCTVRIVPMEGYTPKIADGAGLVVPPIVPGHALYQAAEFDVNFSARPFAILPNSLMFAFSMDFYDTDGSRKRLTHYPGEFQRYVQVFVDDMDSRISASVGSSMVFRVPSGIPAGVDNASFSGIPDMVIPDAKIILRVFGLPGRYLTSSNSYIVRYKGFINQKPFMGKVPGSMLYVGPKVVRTYYPPQLTWPPQPTVTLHDGSLASFGLDFLVDVDLNFIYTTRRRYAPEAAPGDFSTDPDLISNTERPNPSWIDGPHQWLGHFPSKRFFYVHARTGNFLGIPFYAAWTPYYQSVPHQILLADPDVPGVVINL